MSQLVILNFTQGSFAQGCPTVIAQLWQVGSATPMQFRCGQSTARTGTASALSALAAALCGAVCLQGLAFAIDCGAISDRN